ncbi:MAG: hypothetical protein ACKOC5_19505 [Chloroflexota bacterium]
MHFHAGLVSEIHWHPELGRSAWIQCAPPAIPTAGRYLLAWSPQDPDAPLAAALFPARPGFREPGEPTGFLAAAPAPAGWEPGAALQLRGPLGRGFEPPPGLRRLALAAFGPSAERLLPLIDPLLQQGGEVALFSDGPLPSLPEAVEANPLAALPDALAWADFLALDLPLGLAPTLHDRLGLPQGARVLPCAAQALIYAPMPCGGAADCGACAIDTRRGWKLACQDGPVFPVEELFNF